MTSTASVPITEKLTTASESNVNNEDEIGNFQIRPNLNNLFQEGKVREVIVDVFQQVLDGKEYTKSEVATWCRQIVNDINSRVADLNMPRYAHVVQITMMEQTGAGSRSISRCLWDASCDSTVHEIYKSKTMICIVSVYGVYRY